MFSGAVQANRFAGRSLLRHAVNAYTSELEIASAFNLPVDTIPAQGALISQRWSSTVNAKSSIAVVGAKKCHRQLLASF
jgi:hypothetical protein